jgi:hypothetical protein
VLTRVRVDTGEVNRLGARALVLLGALVLATLGAWSNPTPAFACDCARISMSRALEQADAVFRGTVVSLDAVGHGDDARTDIRFRVDTVFKGTAYAEQVVATSRADRGCGLPVAVDSTWVVFALEGIEGTGDDAVNRLITSSCSGNIASADAPAVLGRPRPPLPGRSDREEQATSTDRALSSGLRVVGVVGLTLVVLAGAGLAVLWRTRP